MKHIYNHMVVNSDAVKTKVRNWYEVEYYLAILSITFGFPHLKIVKY